MSGTWSFIKEINIKLSRTLFQKQLVVNDVEIFVQKATAKSFNKIFSRVWPKASSKIPHLLVSSKNFLHGYYPDLEEKLITQDKLNEALKTSKIKKEKFWIWWDFSDVVRNISPSVFEPMKNIFNLSIEKGIFPDELKIAKVTPLFKKGN